MRVLVVHNRYSSRVPSGENLAVDDEVKWLRDAGVAVTTFETSNDDVFGASRSERLRQAAWATWSLPEQRRMAHAVDETKPDLVHVHNLFPLLSSSVPWAATRRNVPVVWTVHNRRVACVIGTNFRDGKPCHECRPGWRVPGVRHGCYGGSAAASAVATGASSVFSRLARRRLTPLAISEHVKDWLVNSAGFDPERVRVKYNGVTGPSPESADGPPSPTDSRTFLCSGYLTDYKGVSLLLDAWQQVGEIDAELRIVGSGPLSEQVRAAAAADSRITWFPQVAADEMAGHYSAARAVIVPSIWDEPFGRSAAEALAYGLPVVTTGTGGLGEIVDESSGWVTGVEAGALADAIRQAATADQAIAERSAAGRQRYRAHFAPDVVTSSLVAIYDSILTQPDAHVRIGKP